MIRKCENFIKELLEMPLFEGIEEEQLRTMLPCLNAYVKEYKKDTYIFYASEKIDTIGLIVNGTIQMIREDFFGNKTLLLTMKTGEMFGETFACNADQNATVSFQANTDTIIVFLPFRRVMHSCSMACVFHHKLMENMVAILAKKNTALMDKVDVISKKTLREKIYTYLLQEASKHNSPYFDLPLGRVQLAEYLCADRSALTRELNQMKQDGLIDYDKNSFYLKK